MQRTIILFFIILLLFSCKEKPSTSHKNSKTLFTKLSAEQSGIDFRNDLIDDPLDPSKNVLDFFNYYNGGGVAVGDFNNDGLEDLVFSGNEVLNKIYINQGKLKFKDITKSANINENKYWTTGVMVEDINNDGYDDIYFCQSGPFASPGYKRKNLVFINNKDLTFSEKAKELGLDDLNLSHHAVFFDYDRDGDKDCFVMNTSIYVRVPIPVVLEHLKKNKLNLEIASSNLFRNDNGKFTKVTEEAGLLRYGFGLSVIISDINNDGWLDIYQTNDYSVPDFMYINQKNGSFKDEINERTKNITWFAMGGDIADFDNDGNLDIGVVDMAATDHVRGKTLMASMNREFVELTAQLGYQKQYMFNSMQKNNGDGTFNNVAAICGVLASEWSWAALFADFDNDGWKDYFVTNGFRRYARDNDSRLRIDEIRKQFKGSVPVEKRKELYQQIPQIKIPNYMFKNQGPLNFEEVGDLWGLDEPSYSNGAVYSDLDNDGDLDLIISDLDDLAKVYVNNSNNHFLDIKLESDQPLEGTKVYIYHDEMTQLQEYGKVRGFQSSVTPQIHFGLGDIKQVDSLKIYWPDGKYTLKKGISSNKRLTFNSKTAVKSERNLKKIDPIFREIESIFTHSENSYDDYIIEVLLPYKQSTLGPFIGVGDVNQDGTEDFYVGGAKGQSGQLMVGKKGSNRFENISGPWSRHAASEDMGSHFFDFDNDGDLDLYVVSAGNDFERNDILLQDRLYENQGKGSFKDATILLPKIRSGGSRVKSADIDLDGDLDLFVAGRLEPKYYPYASRSYILINENGKFIDKTEAWSPDLLNPGLINDFLFTDINEDDKPDLILAGEWMPLMAFVNTGNTLTDESSSYFPENLSGWHFRIEETDIDGDGDLDLIVGNLGLNSKFVASKKKPFMLFANDFDENGTWDLVLAKDYKGKTVPVRGRECSSEQMPFILDKFETYSEYALASLEDILGEEKLAEGLAFEVNNFETGIYYRDGSTYSFKPLNRTIQQSVTNSIIVNDFNSDGLPDLLLAGNIYNMEVETPALDASNGFLLLQNNNGGFQLEINHNIGLHLAKDVKDMVYVNSDEGSAVICVANNNGPMQMLEIRK